MMMKPGYVLITTLLIIALSVTLLTTVMRRSFVYQDRVRFYTSREKARVLALSGLEVALSQLAVIVPKEQASKDSAKSQNGQETKTPTSANSTGAQETAKKEDKLTPEQEFLKQLLPIVNNWQQFALTEDKDGIEGTLKLYISCEQGKINLHRLLALAQDKKTAEPVKTNNSPKTNNNQPPKAQNSVNNQKTFADTVQERILTNMNVNIIELLKERRASLGRALEDPTELLGSPLAKGFNVQLFAEPSEQTDRPKTKQPLYLMDLFTTYTSSANLNPWVLSDSVALLFGLKPMHAKGEESSDPKPLSVQEKVKRLQPFISWQKQWDVLMGSQYGKKISDIPKEISTMFGSQFEATVFSVVSYGTVNGVTQKVSAVVEETTPPQTVSPKSIVFTIKKLYWL